MLTPDQIAMRTTGIGASESPMLLGESPHGGPIDLYLRKVGLSEDAPSPEQEMGNYLEEGVARYYADKTGSHLEPATTLRHPQYPWLLATPDRWVNGRRKLLQIKMVGSWMAHHWRDTEDGIPDYVRIQVTQEMDVAGVPICDVCAVLGGTKPAIYQVEYDPELAEAIREVVRAFWFGHVVPRVYPPLDGSESATELLKRLYPRHRPATLVEATAEAEAWARELRAARAMCATGEQAKALAEQQLKALLGDSEGMRGDGWTVTWRTNKAGARPFLFDDETVSRRKDKAA
jgi:putative phage-type endonuclease